jgi:cytochrome P450
MKVDYQSIDKEIQLPSLRNNTLTGGAVSALSEAFATNVPMISMGEPVRTQVREYLDTHYLLPETMSLTSEEIQAKCAVILNEWVEGESPTDPFIMRSVATQITIFLTTGILISKQHSERATKTYLMGVLKIILFREYFAFLVGVMGIEKQLKKDVYLPLRELGVPNPVIDYTLFAAMISIGGLFIECVKNIRAHHLTFGELQPAQKTRLVIESIRLQPTVTTTHRVVESPENTTIAGKTVTLTGGDTLVYPLVCANTDERKFKCPHQFDLNRSQAEYDNVLSWSKGSHDCPAKDFSIQVTLAMLNTLNARIPLATIQY